MAQPPELGVRRRVHAHDDRRLPQLRPTGPALQRALQHEQHRWSCKVWNGTKYWLKPNMAMAAVPGTSNHGWGCAVDTALVGYGSDAKTVDSAFLQWALENAAANGWSWEVQSEPWHLRLAAASASPQAPQVLSEAPVLQKAPAPTLRLKSSGGQVAALQAFCLRYSWGDCRTADGNLGPKTEAAVKLVADHARRHQRRRLRPAVGLGPRGLPPALLRLTTPTRRDGATVVVRLLGGRSRRRSSVSSGPAGSARRRRPPPPCGPGGGRAAPP